MSAITCKTCCFWQPPPRRTTESYGFEGDGRPETGQCRRHAPEVMRTDNGLRAMWPITMGHHWCGEHGSVERAEDDVESRTKSVSAG